MRQQARWNPTYPTTRGVRRRSERKRAPGVCAGNPMERFLVSTYLAPTISLAFSVNVLSS